MAETIDQSKQDPNVLQFPVDQSARDHITRSRVKMAETASRDLVAICHGFSSESGWWTDLQTGGTLKGKKNIPELLMLVVSELGEAMEGHRKNKMDDHLTHRRMLEVELADALIRIFDMAGGMGLDVAGALAEKLAYNAQRADHKIENRQKEDGKKY